MGLFSKINKKFLFSIGILTLSFILHAETQRNFVVVLDAGHGGHDPGAHGPYGDEKNVTLSIVLKLGRELSKIPNVVVYYTRTSDVFVELARRAQIANDAHADLFISIHCNANSRSAPYGTETWVLGSEDSRQKDNFSVVQRENSVIYLEDDYEKTYDGFNPNSPEDLIAMTLLQDVHYDNSITMAHLIEKEFSRDNRTSRGVKQSGFAVLWRTAMPSVLIETGFITNYDEGSYICSDSGQEQITESIVDAFLNYKNMWDKKNIGNYTSNSYPTTQELPIADGVYTIQILASNYLYAPNAPQLRGLKNITIVKSGNFYKYYYEFTQLESEKNKFLEETKNLGFKTAFALLIKNNEAQSYAIELFSSNKKYNSNQSLFNGIDNVFRIKNNDGDKFSYYAYVSKNFQESLKNLETAQSKGFNQALIVINPPKN